MVWRGRVCGRTVGFEVAPLAWSDLVLRVTIGASYWSRVLVWSECRCASSSEHGCLEWTLVSPLVGFELYGLRLAGRAGNVRRFSALL